MSQPSTSPATLASLSQKIENSVASAKKDEASRLFKIAQRTCDYLESHVGLDLYGMDLRPIANSVLCHFERLVSKHRQTEAADSHCTSVQVADHTSSKNQSQDRATQSEMENVTRDDLDEVSDAFYEGTKTFLGEAKEEKEREKAKGKPRGRLLVRHNSEPRTLVAALHDINANVNEFLDSWIPPEQVDCSLEA